MEGCPDIVVGLGNPGERYFPTRHNLGFRVVDRLAAAAGLRLAAVPGLDVPARACAWAFDRRPVVLAQPLTYMNRSGEAVQALLERYACPAPARPGPR